MTQKKAGHPTLFTRDEEQAFIHHLNAVSEWGFPFDTLDLRLMAKGYLDRQGRNCPQLRGNLPSRDWAQNVLKRQKCNVTQRLSANISTKQAAITHDTIDSFFRNAGEVLNGVPPTNIINYDETNLTDDPGNKKFIFKRGCRYPERLINTTKSSISIMYAGTAAGHLLPPYVVYKAEHLWDTWTVGGPAGTRFNRSRSGWFDLVCFEDWFLTVVVPYVRHIDGVKVLIGDNLSSHFSKKVLQECDRYNIKFVCLPPNATHILQPLDVAFYGPLKKYWRNILTAWKKGPGRRQTTLSKDSFPALLQQLNVSLEDGGRGRENLISGFSKTGLYPLNANRPKVRVPNGNVEDDNASTSTSTTVSNVVVDMLSSMRHQNGPNDGKQTRRKRLDVEPGKSVTADDLIAPKATQAQSKFKRTRLAVDSSSSESSASDICDDRSDDFDDEDHGSATEENIQHCVDDFVVVEYAKKKMTLQYIGVVKGSDDKFYEPDP